MTATCAQDIDVADDILMRGVPCFLRLLAGLWRPKHGIRGWMSPAPAGQLFHAAGPSADGWMIIAVHDSREGWERFRDGILMPRMAQGIAGGFTAPPEETGFEICNEVTA